MTTVIDNSADLLDSRDVIARIEELEASRDAFPEAADTTAEGGGTWAEECPEDAAELAVLTALAEEAEGYAADWRHGETLIRDSYFEDYARELAEDIGAVKSDMSWPYTSIDWEQAANELKQDYTSVDFDGVTYWVR